MSKLCVLLAGAGVLFLTGCADGLSPDHRPAMRFDTAPVEFSRNPKMTSELVHSFTSNEEELLKVAQRIEAEARKQREAEAAIAELEAEAAKPPAPTPLPESNLIY